MSILQRYRVWPTITLLSIGLMACSNHHQSGYQRIDDWAQKATHERPLCIGYPNNEAIDMSDFYEWYTANHLDQACISNAGDPFAEDEDPTSALGLERDVIEWFAPYYGIDTNNVWGIVTTGGTDGNNHGLYFGMNFLKQLSDKSPIVYLSEEAHYSNTRLLDLQQLDVRYVATTPMGNMDPEALRQVIDPTHPCLILFAYGSTFRGAIDPIAELNQVLAQYPEMPVYRHIDAALCGGYLPFTSYKALTDLSKLGCQSISVSGQKFFGSDEPSGIFLTTQDIYQSQDKHSSHLNDRMKMINCSRSAMNPLKFWWLIHRNGEKRWAEEAETIMANTQYLMHELDSIHWPNWANEGSNTVFFKRPASHIMDKYTLASGYHEAFGGELAHIVVMQGVSKEIIDEFIQDLSNESHAEH